MRILFLICGLFFFVSTYAQPGSKRITRAEYIEMYKDDAIKEMKRSGVPASITLAQGILESGDGNSALARYAKNHFGIKCHSGWTGGTFIQDDDEKDECFRKYKTVLESYKDHSDFLQKKRYAFLFNLKITDYKGWAKGLKKAGYATNPKYPQLLIDIIEKNELYKYDTAKGQKQLSKKQKTKKGKSKKTKVVKSKRKGSHQIMTHKNNIRYIEVKPEDTFDKIADEFEMGLWQLYKYNDIEKDSDLFENGILYLQPKRGKAKEDLHIVATGETMWEISQKHGIKLDKLYKKNRMSLGDEPNVGDKLYLRSKKPQ